MTNTTPSNLIDLAIGRLLALGSRPSQVGDVEEYERCKAIILLPRQICALMKNCSGPVFDLACDVQAAWEVGDVHGLRTAMVKLAKECPGFSVVATKI